MQDNNRQYRRAVSLYPELPSESRKASSLHENPLYENLLYENQTKGSTDERNSSIRRQVSEPARNPFASLKTNIVSRAESIKS